MEQLTNAQQRDLKVLANFIRVYCAARHRNQAAATLPGELAETFRKGISLCPDCQGLLTYALTKRRNCPLDPKPSCKECHIHCYSKEYRTRIREIMAFSGRRMIMRGRLDYLWHYLF
ncbi:MAG TPA: nitrous oxide-stimulated promoter family protein [Geobacteraceae bacterium]